MRKLLILLLISVLGVGAQTYDTGSANTNTGGGTSVAVAMGVNATSGHLIGVCVSISNGAAYNAPTLTDTQGTSYTKQYLLSNIQSLSGYLEFWWGLAPSSGANTVTWASTSAVALSRIGVASWGGIAASPLDQTVTSATGTASTAITTGSTGTTAQANELALSCLYKFNTAPTLTAGSGYTSRAKVDTIRDGFMLQEKILTSTGTVVGDGTASSNTSWGAMVATFKAATTAVVRHRVISGAQ